MGGGVGTGRETYSLQSPPETDNPDRLPVHPPPDWSGVPHPPAIRLCIPFPTLLHAAYSSDPSI